MSRQSIRNLVILLVIAVLSFSTISCLSESDSIKLTYEQLTTSYMDSHLHGLAEEFSLESGIIEETCELLFSAGIIDGTNYEAGEYLFGKCEEVAIKNGIPWSGLIDIPFLYRLFDYADGQVSNDGQIIRITVDKWTRATLGEGSFFIGEADSDLNLIEGIYFYAASDALYWGTFSNNLRNGTGCILYPNNDCYNGSWKNDQMSGYGVYYFGGQSTGEYYGGFWENNMMNGEGTYVINGTPFRTTWVNNVPAERLEKEEEEAQPAPTQSQSKQSEKPVASKPYIGLSEANIGKTALGTPSRSEFIDNKFGEGKLGYYFWDRDNKVLFVARTENGKVRSVTDMRTVRGGGWDKNTPLNPDDPYEVYDYSNPEDFYDDHYDDFIDYYAAEEYWEDHQ